MTEQSDWPQRLDADERRVWDDEDEAQYVEGRWQRLGALITNIVTGLVGGGLVALAALCVVHAAQVIGR